MNLPDWLIELDGLIASVNIPLLRVWIKNFADIAEEKDVIKISEFILQCGIEIHQNNQINNRLKDPEV